MRLRLFGLTTVILLLAAPAFSQCQGENLFAAMAEAELSALQAASDAVPYAKGNFWRATKEDQLIHLVGTYHMDDPRHAQTLVMLADTIAGASQLLVEAGPIEMAALKKHLAEDPSLMVNTTGPTMPEVLAPDDWEKLQSAMAERGVPGFMAAKLKPWYLTMMLSIPACAMAEMGEGSGLDGALMDAAAARDLPISALEPYDTVFGIFGAMSEEDQISMITQALALDDQSADMSVTLADSYFQEEGRLIWELTLSEAKKLPGQDPEQLDAEFAAMEQALMISRNRAWIPVITEAAENGPVLVGFGALHLSGEAGVLNLLAQRGYTLERLAFR